MLPERPISAMLVTACDSLNNLPGEGGERVSGA
jgi:hypothetical protein